MRFLICIFMVLVLSGCSFKNMLNSDTSEKTHEIKQQQTAGTHSAKIKRGPAREGEVPLPSTITGGPDGFTLTVQPDMEVEINSKRETESESDVRKDSATSLVQTAMNLPWGVYAAVIALVAGGLFVTFKISPGYGIPMIIGGVLVYAVFVTFNLYPMYAALVVGGAGVIGAGFVIWHLSKHKGLNEDVLRKQDVIAAIKRGIDRLDPSVKKDVTDEIKNVAGDNRSPLRRVVDEEVRKA